MGTWGRTFQKEKVASPRFQSRKPLGVFEKVVYGPRGVNKKESVKNVTTEVTSSDHKARWSKDFDFILCEKENHQSAYFEMT